MNEMKRGFLKDYHRNGEPKTQKEKDRERNIGDVIGLLFLISAFIFFALGSVYLSKGI